MGINKTLEAHIKLKTLEQIPLSTIDAIKFKENLDKDLRYLIEHKNSKKEVEECFKNAKNKYFNDLLYHWLNYIVSILEIKEYSNTYSHKYLFNKYIQSRNYLEASKELWKSKDDEDLFFVHFRENV